MLTSLVQFSLWALLTAGATPEPSVLLPPGAQTQGAIRSCFYVGLSADGNEQGGSESRWPLPIALWTRPFELKVKNPVPLLPEEPAFAQPAQPAWRGLALGSGPPPRSELFEISDPFRLQPFTDPRAFDGKATAQLEGPWGSLKSKLELESAARDLHGRDGEHWQAEEALQVPVAGPLYVFGQVNYGYNTWTAQQLTVSGRSGVGCKLRPVKGGEIVLTGGSVLNYQEDPLQPNRLPQEKSQLVLELQARYSLLGALKMEYQGSATPALDPLERNRMQHDFRFALPLGQAGDVHVGAKRQWEDVPGPPRPWTDGMQLYLGVGLKR
jgi:hypothetical protein